MIRQDSQTPRPKPRFPIGLQITFSVHQGVVTRIVEDLRCPQVPTSLNRLRNRVGWTNNATTHQQLLRQQMQPALEYPSTPDLPLSQRTLQDVVITTTPNGVVVHWPATDLSPDFE